MSAYVEQAEVVGPFADLKRDDMTAVIPAIISEAQRAAREKAGTWKKRALRPVWFLR